MYLKFTRKDVLVISTLCLLKLGVGFISSMVITVFPALVQISNNTNNFSSATRNIPIDAKKLGYLYLTKNLCQIVMSPIIGHFSSFSRVLIFLLIGTVFQFASIMVYGLGKYYELILGRVLEGVSASLINCAAAAYVAYRFKDHKQRGFVYGAKALSNYIGISLGPAFSGFVFQFYGQMIVFFSFFSFIFIEIIFVLLMIFLTSEKGPPDRLHVEVVLTPLEGSANSAETGKLFTLPSDQPESLNLDGNIENVLLNGNKSSLILENEDKLTKISSKKNDFKTNFRFLKDPYFLICLGTFPVTFVSMYLLFSSLPSYMKMAFKSPESKQGIVWIVTLLGYFLGFITGNVVNTRFSSYRHLVMMAYIFIHALAVLSVPLVPTWWSVTIPLCIIAHVHLLAEVVLSPILATIVETRHDSNFGAMSGIAMMVMAVTGALGSFLGPFLLSTIGYLFMNIGLCVLNILYAPLFILFRRFCQRIN